MSEFPILLIIFAAFLIASSINIVKENERIVVFRSGRFLKIGCPGLVLSIPIVDKIKRVNLDKLIPNWKAITDDDINDRIKKYILSQ